MFSFGVNDTTLHEVNTRVQILDSIQNTRQILSSAEQLFPVLMVGSPAPTDEHQNSRIVGAVSRICTGLLGA